jgi:hypothetical protein
MPPPTPTARLVGPDHSGCSRTPDGLGDNGLAVDAQLGEVSSSVRFDVDLDLGQLHLNARVLVAEIDVRRAEIIFDAFKLA